MSDLEKNDHPELLRQQTVLAKFGQLALKSDDLDEILTEACRLVGEALGTDLAKVVELQEDGKTLLVRAGVGWKPGIVGVTTIEVADDTSESVALKTNEPMISPDIGTETRFRYPPFLTENGVKAVANVVIISGKDRPPFGILQVDSREPREFTDADTAFLGGYANLLAAAVDRLRVIGEVREGKERLHLALEAGQLGSWEIDLASGAATRTPRHDQIFGYADPPATRSYDAFLDHMLPEDRKRVDDAFRNAVDAGTGWHFECRIRRAGDGEVRWVELRGRSAGGRVGGPPTHLLGIVTDVTARKETDEALRRSNEWLETKVAERTAELSQALGQLHEEVLEREQAEDALRQSQKMEAVGQLTGGIAHDFNNLLQGITGSINMAQHHVAQGRIGELDRLLSGAMTSAMRAAALTHRLLAFSRRQPLDPKPTLANPLVASMEDLLRRTMGETIQFELVLSGGLWLTLCDPNQLENAVLNLVINARDAMPDGGRLTIETCNAHLNGAYAAQTRGVRPGQYVCIAVTDTGTGMTPEVIERAFDPFFTTKPTGQGTGLGLSMIYGFAQQSEGYCKIHSEVGRGTTVKLYLPRTHGEAADSGPLLGLTELHEAESGEVVLVVEDEPVVRGLVVEVLRDLGYDALEAADGVAGLEVLRSRRRIDLLVTDVGLPGLNGRQMADAAREHRPGLKVLFMTGYAENATIASGFLEPGMAMITKPFAMEALASRIRGMIEADRR